ncbi:unnamed protein product [Clavelina lepadiformis]|uniref:G-protein coupled receptors family 1 profile domain-containing protein n=1 Tax=Clavelina lepadiformis TaxID=159417 RepID=A0ABP0FD05_CLALP
MTCDLGAGKISDNCLFPTHQNDNKTITLVSDFCGGNVEKVEYEPNRNSIFDYLSWIKNVIENDANFSNTTKNDFLEAECHETNFDLSLYYRVINSQICQDYHRNIQNEDKLITFCSSKQLLDNLTQDQLFGDNYDDISYSCRLYIFTHNFISCRNQQKVTCLMHKNNSKTQYISYKETTYEDIPFCFPFTCPYFEYLEPENLPALSVIGKNVFDCMPQTCQLAHYAIAIVDSFMSLLTVLVNGLILLVATRTGHFNCSHGYFSVSLAVADLIVGLITEPCMVYNHFKQGNRNLAKREEYEDWI